MSRCTSPFRSSYMYRPYRVLFSRYIPDVSSAWAGIAASRQSIKASMCFMVLGGKVGEKCVGSGVCRKIRKAGIPIYGHLWEGKLLGALAMVVIWLIIIGSVCLPHENSHFPGFIPLFFTIFPHFLSLHSLHFCFHLPPSTPHKRCLACESYEVPIL